MISALTHNAMKEFSNIACSYLTDPPQCCGIGPKDVMEYRPSASHNVGAHFQCEECGRWVDIADMEIATKMNEVFISNEYKTLLSSIEDSQADYQAGLIDMLTLSIENATKRCEKEMLERINLLEHERGELIIELHRGRLKEEKLNSQNNDLISALNQAEDVKTELLIALNKSSTVPVPEDNWTMLASPSKLSITPTHAKLPSTFEKQHELTKKLTNLYSYNVEQLFTTFAAASLDGLLNRRSYNNAFRQLIKKSDTYKTIDKETIETLVDNIFISLDHNKHGTISTWDLICGLTFLCSGSKRGKLECLFSQYNLTRDHLERSQYCIDLQTRTCTCPDYKYRCNSGHLTCKHLRIAYKYQLKYHKPVQATIVNGYVHVHDMYIYLRALYKVMYVIDCNMYAAMGNVSAGELARNDSALAFKNISTKGMTFLEFCRNPS